MTVAVWQRINLEERDFLQMGMFGNFENLLVTGLVESAFELVQCFVFCEIHLTDDPDNT